MQSDELAQVTVLSLNSTAVGTTSQTQFWTRGFSWATRLPVSVLSDLTSPGTQSLLHPLALSPQVTLSPLCVLTVRVNQTVRCLDSTEGWMACSLGNLGLLVLLGACLGSWGIFLLHQLPRRVRRCLTGHPNRWVWAEGGQPGRVSRPKSESAAGDSWNPVLMVFLSNAL